MKSTYRRELTEAISGIEEVFVFLAEAYPTLLKEVDKSREYADRFVSNFSGENSLALEGGLGLALNEASKDAVAAIEDDVEAINALRDTERGQLEVLKGCIDGITELGLSIGKVIDISGGLEIIAMNSMVQALKVGSDGGGFSYIAREMSVRTEETIRLAKVMSGIEEKLRSLGKDFYGFSDSLSETGTTLTEGIVGDIREQLTAIGGTVSRIIDSIRAMSGDASGVKEPLYSIMESLQIQDIIHQSLDQVVIIADSLPDLSGGESDADLDDLSFTVQALKVAASIIDEARDKLSENCVFYKNKVGLVESVVSRLRGDNLALSDVFACSDPDDPEEMTDLLQILEKDRDSLGHALESMASDTSGLKNKGERILQEVGDLSRASENIVDVVDGYWNIIVAARMESVKQASLRGLSQTVDDMDTLVTDIGDIAKDVFSQSTDIHRDSADAMAAHEESIGEIRTAVEKLDQRLRGTLNKLRETSSGITNELCQFSVFSGDFINVFDDSRSRISDLQSHSDLLGGIGSSMTGMADEAESKLKEALAGRGLADWNIRDNRLQSVVDDFTIFSNKQLAQELTGSIIEEDRSQEGEVTLF